MSPTAAPPDLPFGSDWSRRPRPPTFLPHLGNEPPLQSGGVGPAAMPVGRHALNLRWLGASVLAGLAGAALLGSAIYVSSEGEWTFAEIAERAAGGPIRSADGGSGPNRKADKLVRAETVAAAKQAFRSPVTLRAGDREVIKVRSFVRIATGLSTVAGVYATDIPAFNPLRFFADSTPERTAEAPPETSDAEVSVVKTDLLTLGLDGGGQSLSDEQVVTQLVEEARIRAETGRRSLTPLPSAMMLSRTLGTASPVLGAPDPARPEAEASFRSIDVRVVPENVTTVVKAATAGGEAGLEERVVPIRRGETLDVVLRNNGAGPEDGRAMAAILLNRDRNGAALEGMQVRLLLSSGDSRRVLRAVLFGERGIEAIAAANDRGAFVSVTPPQSTVARAEKPATSGEDDEEEDEAAGGITLYASLYETALKQELPRQTVEELVRIFGSDVDFQRRVSPGDSFELFYATDDEGGTERVEILSAALTVGQDVHRVYRYQGDDGAVEYFDESGRSLKKFLVRKPVVEARLSSGFGTRYHPILRYAKMHTGVDWAAKVGTPIFAAGNGTISKIGYDSGYGRRTEIQHANGYVTTYNHQSAFARGMAGGIRVRQGQIIGYVGSSGLSTGAHLHFEVQVNGHFVDPMKIRVPRGRELDGRALADFGRQRDQTNELLQRAGSTGRLAGRETR